MCQVKKKTTRFLSLHQHFFQDRLWSSCSSSCCSPSYTQLTELYSCSTACCIISSVYHPDNEKPLVGNITISAVSWDGFNISWELKRGELDGFLIQVSDPFGLSEFQNHTVSGQEHSLAITDLSPSTFYRITLYGLYRGDLLEPVFGEAFTGTAARQGLVYGFSCDDSNIFSGSSSG